MLAGASLPDGKYQIRIRMYEPQTKKTKPTPPPLSLIQPVQDNSPVKSTSAYKTFQIIPHSNVKNEKIDQFADILADSFQEVYKRFFNGKLQDPDRIFFETVITNKSYQTFLTTNTPIAELVEQQAKMIWKNVTLQEASETEIKHENTVGYDIKLKHPYFMSLKTDRRLQEIPLAELLEISRIMADGDLVRIQFGFQAAEENWFKEAEDDMKDFEKKKRKKWRGKEYSQATLMKSSQYGFDFVLRVLVQSPDPRRQRRIARGIILALKQLNHDNELVEKQIKQYRMKRWLDDMQQCRLSVPFFFGKRQILTGPEIAHLIKLPQRSLQEEYPIIESVSNREVTISENITDGGISLGSTTFRGQDHPVYMPTDNHDELCLPHIVIGGMGSGKTKGFGANWIVEAVNNNFGAMAIDPAKGEIGDEVESSLPNEKVNRIKLGNVAIALDWPEIKYSSRAKNRLANTIVSFFNTTSDEAGAQTARFLRAAVMGMKTGKLKEIVDIFENEDYRKKIIDSMTDSMHKTTLVEYDEYKDGRQRQIISPIYNRLDVILGDEYLQECFESNNSLDMVEIMSQRKATIIDVPKSLLGSEGVDLIVNLLSSKIDLAMTLREEENQFPYFVLYDEPHQFLRSAKTWKSAVVESRKWRVGYIWMFHSWEQIPRDLGEIIKAAGPHYHIYPSSKKTYTDLREEIAPFTVEDALKLKRFHAINIIRTGGEVTTPFIALMSKPPSEQRGNIA